MATDKSKRSNGEGIKTLAIRLPDAQHAQLSMIAQLNERTLTDELRLAVEHWIEQSSASPAFAARAKEVIAEIERDAEIRRSAISALVDTKPTPQTRGRKTDSSS